MSKLTLTQKEAFLLKAYEVCPDWSKLPYHFRTICENYAASTGQGVPLEMYLYPVLTATATMTGHSVITVDASDSIEDGLPAIMWSKVLAPSGSNKSGVFKKLHHALERAQGNIRRNRFEMDRFYEANQRVTVARLESMLSENNGRLLLG